MSKIFSLDSSAKANNNYCCPIKIHSNESETKITQYRVKNHHKWPFKADFIS